MKQKVLWSYNDQNILNQKFGNISNLPRLQGKKDLDKINVVWKLCHGLVKYSGNTTDLGSHLNRHHPELKVINPVNPQEQHPLIRGQQTIDNTLVNKLPGGSKRAKHITGLIAQLMAKDLQPYSVWRMKVFGTWFTTWSHIGNAEQLVQALTPVAVATKIMSDEKDRTLFVIGPLQAQLLQDTRENIGDSPFVRHVKAAIHQDLDKRYTTELEKATLNMASALDIQALA